MRAHRKNMERMSEAVPDCDEQSLQHFISNSPWDESAVLRQIGMDADILIGDDPDSCLLVDEVGFKKAGKKSVGVARQWLGRFGKVDNGQVGVFLALNCLDKVTLTDTRLFLPECWTNSQKRMKRVGVPKDRHQHKKKTELALEMIESARERNSKNSLKFSLSNAPEESSTERLAFMQGQRFFVERAIEDGKSTCGMADYQVRGWTGWHHHMAMVMLAMLFMLKMKVKYGDAYELLSSNDIRELLYHFLPKRAISEDEVLRQMQVRHRKRQNAILHHSKTKT